MKACAQGSLMGDEEIAQSSAVSLFSRGMVQMTRRET